MRQIMLEIPGITQPGNPRSPSSRACVQWIKLSKSIKYATCVPGPKTKEVDGAHHGKVGGFRGFLEVFSKLSPSRTAYV